MVKLSSSKSQSPSRHKKTRNSPRAQSKQKKPNMLLTVFLCLLVFFGICLFIVSMVVRSFGVGHIIRNIDILGMLEDFSTGEHSYYITDQINNLPFNETEVTLNDIEEFLKREAVTNEIDRIMSRYATALMFGNRKYHVTVNDIVVSARNIEPELEEFFSHHMTGEDFYTLAHTLDDIIDFNSLDIEGIMIDFDMGISPLPLILLSPVFLWVVGLASIGLLIVLFLLRKYNIAAALTSAGLPVAVSGLILYGIGTLIDSFLVFADDEPIGLTRFLYEPVHLLSQLSLITAVIGVLILIVSLVVRLVRR